MSAPVTLVSDDRTGAEAPDIALLDKRIAVICVHADPFDPAGLREGGGTHSYIREMMGFCGAKRMKYVVLTRWANSHLPERQGLPDGGALIRLRIGPISEIDKRTLDNLHDETLSVAERAISTTIGTPDIIHSAYWNSGRAAMDLSRKWNCPFVHAVISNGWRRLRAGLNDQPACRLHVERAVFQAAAAVICVSEEERRDVRDGYQIHPKRLIVVGRPVHQRFHEPCRDGLGQPRSPLSDVLAGS